MGAIVQRLCSNIFKFSCSPYGVRCIQMMVDVSKNDDVAAQSICHALHGHICTLTRDLYGACSHPYGCCVMQLVLERCDSTELMTFVNKLLKDAVRLAQCPYGNYVVQLLIGLKDRNCTNAIVGAMHGHIGDLSAHKFSSNVVEKCLQVGDREARTAVIRELVAYDGFERLLQDPFGNYVIQKAMSVAHGDTLDTVMDAIRPHVDTLRAAPYGRRIYNKFYKHERIMGTATATRDAPKDMADM